MIVKTRQKGFTLLEILIAMSILMTIVIAVTNMLKNSLDLKFALGEKNTVTQKINRVLHKISYDVNQAFLLSQKDMLRDAGKNRTIFQIEKSTDSDTLRMTYTGHKPSRANSHESSLSYVVYKVEESKKFPGRKHLYRGTVPRVPESFKEDPPMTLFADNVHSIKFYPWVGDDWSKDKWDSTQSTTQNKIPHMLLMEIYVWIDEPIEGETREEDNALERYATIVYLGNSLDIEEIKDPVKRFKI